MEEDSWRASQAVDAAARAYALNKVPEPLRESKREAYEPKLISLGPLHQDRLSHLMIGRHFKFHCFRSMGPVLVERLRWMVRNGVPEATAMDSVFLFCFLDYLLGPSENVFHGFDYVESRLKCDVVMVENQLPLTVLKEVFAEVVKAHHFSHHKSVNGMLSRAVLKLSPFVLHQIQSSILPELDQDHHPRPLQCPAAGPNHLLDMLLEQLADLLTVKLRQQQDTTQKSYSWLSRLRYRADDAVASVMGLFMKHPAKRGKHFVQAYNAQTLIRAGIRLRAFTRFGQHIHLDMRSATLYLPRLIMSHVYTEVLLRNVMALEFNDAAAEKRPVSTYVQLMDCLIDTSDDVRLLRQCHVIVCDSLMLSYSDIVRLWQQMCEPFFSGRLEPPLILKNELQEVLIKNYYRSKIIGILKELWDTYFWQRGTATLVAMLVGILMVAADFIQIFCALTPKCKG